MNLPLIIGVVLAVVVFVVLWRRGSLQRISNYWNETKEELRKCTWPTVEELKSSTVVVLLSILLLGLFTVTTDFVISSLVQWWVA